MTDSSDKKSKETLDQSSRHESLHSRLEAIDKKSQEKPDNLDVDLDVMPDEVESPDFLMNEFQDDEEAIDRLLVNADLDADDVAEQSNVEAVSEIDALDDFLGFSDFDEPDMVPAAADDESDQVTENSSAVAADGIDDFFGLSDGYDESELIQDEDALEALDDFSDFSDFVEPEIMPAVEAEEVAQPTVDLSFPGFDADLTDEADDFSGLSDDFDELDLIQDDENEVLPDLDEQLSDDEGAIDSLLLDDAVDSDDALEKTDGEADELFDDADLSDDADDFDDSDMIQIDEVDDWADLVTSIEEPQAVVEESFDDLLDDENNTDSLVLDSDFDEEDALEKAIGETDEFGDNADLMETDSFFQLDEVSDDFSSQTEAVQLAETEVLSPQDEQEDDFLLSDFDITADTEVPDLGSVAETKEDETDDAFGNIDFLNEEEALKVFGPEALEPKPESNEVVVEPEPKQIPIADTVMTALEDPEDLKLSPFGFEQEDIKKQLEEAENRVKKAKLFSYVAMGFGVVALGAAVGLGVLTYGAKSEISKLTEVVSTLEANLAKSAESSSNIVVQQDMVSKELDMLQVKMGGLEDKVSLAPVAGLAKVETAHEPVPLKDGNANEPAKAKTGAVQEPAPSKTEASHKTTPAPAKVEAEPAKTKSQPEAAVQGKEKAQPEAVQAKAKAQTETVALKAKDQPEVVTAKPIAAEKAAVKPEPAKVKIQTAPGKWGVNLGAFKQEWFAKSKAAEYAQQGVLAEVMPVHERDATMYRLRVIGFKTKAEADSNTAKIKKALNLDSVWVSDN